MIILKSEKTFDFHGSSYISSEFCTQLTESQFQVLYAMLKNTFCRLKTDCFGLIKAFLLPTLSRSRVRETERNRGALLELPFQWFQTE